MKKVSLLSLLALVVTVALSLSACNIFCKHDNPAQIVVVEAVAPTCQKTGLTSGTKCNGCGTMMIPQTIEEKIDCISSDWIVDKAATKTEDGSQHKECTMCHKLMSEETIPATGSIGIAFGVNAAEVPMTITIKGIGECEDSDIIIPTTINGHQVTKIGVSAFSSCTSLTSIEIPDGVTSISMCAFSRCPNLTSVVIPGSVTRIGGEAFYDCDSLASITFTGTVEQWNAIKLENRWNSSVPATEVICSNGTVKLK